MCESGSGIGSGALVLDCVLDDAELLRDLCPAQLTSPPHVIYQDKVEERNSNYLKVIRNLKFKNTSLAASEEPNNAGG